jgi:hypothetical protein
VTRSGTDLGGRDVDRERLHFEGDFVAFAEVDVIQKNGRDVTRLPYWGDETRYALVECLLSGFDDDEMPTVLTDDFGWVMWCEMTLDTVFVEDLGYFPGDCFCHAPIQNL